MLLEWKTQIDIYNQLAKLSDEQKAQFAARLRRIERIAAQYVACGIPRLATDRELRNFAIRWAGIGDRENFFVAIQQAAEISGRSFYEPIRYAIEYVVLESSDISEPLEKRRDVFSPEFIEAVKYGYQTGNRRQMLLDFAGVAIKR